LKIDGFVGEEFLQWFRAFVVEALEAGTEAGGVEFGMDGLIADKDSGARSTLDGFGQDAVAIIVVYDDQIIVASAGGNNETSGLIREDFACGFHHGGVTHMSSVIGCGAGGKAFIGSSVWDDSSRKTRGRSNVRGRLFGGALVFTRLVHVTFDRGGGMWGILSKELWCESGEMGDEAFG
jgi:hypothetical protein